MRVQAVKFQPVDQLFRQRSARTFREHRHFRTQFVSRSEVVFRLPEFVHAFVFGEDARNPILFVEQFPAGKLGEDVDAFFFDDAAEPFHDFVERDDVVSVIRERWRRNRQLEGIGFSEIVGSVARHASIERRGFFEIWNKFGHPARVHDCAGKLVGAKFARFFEDVYVLGGERGSLVRRGVFLDQVGEMKGARQAARSGPDD